MSSQITSVGGPSSLGSSTIKQRGNIATLSSSDDTAVDSYGNTFHAPDYTIKEILKAIPAHCYERRVFESLYYVFRDIFWMGVFGYLANNYIHLLPNKAIRGLAWAAYTVVQGLFGTGIWVLAHECGHLAFSDYNWVNDTVGWVLHSYWLVPYFSWKYSHGKHHKATGHMDRDMVFVPQRKKSYLQSRGVDSVEELVSDSPIYTLLQLVFQQTAGWIFYLLFNVSGQALPEKAAWQKNHFNPASVLFEARDYWYIVLSDVGILAQLLVLYTWYKNYGAFNLAVNWFVPYLFVNHWLVFITYLQHSAPEMPHYEAEKWNFARGAAATIDREFGFVGKYIFHDIIETHVLHHYVSRIPFYNAREASEEIKKVMGKHYRHSDENMFVSMWHSGRWCQFVDGDNGILMYRNINGLGVPPKD